MISTAYTRPKAHRKSLQACSARCNKTTVTTMKISPRRTLTYLPPPLQQKALLSLHRMMKSYEPTNIPTSSQQCDTNGMVLATAPGP